MRCGKPSGVETGSKSKERNRGRWFLRSGHWVRFPRAYSRLQRNGERITTSLSRQFAARISPLSDKSWRVSAQRADLATATRCIEDVSTECTHRSRYEARASIVRALSRATAPRDGSPTIEPSAVASRDPHSTSLESSFAISAPWRGKYVPTTAD